MDLSGRSLLAVFAHPDDESIACGGLLARCAELGARVSVICATHGENRSGVRDGELYEIRPRELAAAAQVLGVAEVIVYDYADGFLPWIDAADVRERIEADMRRLRPDVVVTFGDDGLYWHPDHIAMHEVTTAAVAAMGSEAPALFYVTMPPGLMRTVADEHVQQSLSDGPGARLLGVANPDAFGVRAMPPTLIVDVTASAGRKLAALKCHRTQVANSALESMAASDAARYFRVEHFHRAAVGSATPAFIENL